MHTGIRVDAFMEATTKRHDALIMCFGHFFLNIFAKMDGTRPILFLQKFQKLVQHNNGNMSRVLCVCVCVCVCVCDRSSVSVSLWSRFL